MNSLPDTARPNVLFIISDHHRWDYLGCEGAPIYTPNLDALSSRGTLVDGMYSTSPLCVPQRIAITSGRYPMNTGCYSNRHPVDPSIPTFLHGLQNAGVHTALIGKLHHHVHARNADFVAHEPDVHRLGYDFVHETSGKMGVGGIACECRYAEFLRSRGILEEYREWTGRWGEKGTASPHEAWKWPDVPTQDAYIADKGCEFLQNVDAAQPFYLHLGFVGPHPPFDAPSQFREPYENIEPPLDGDKPRNAQAWRAFAACISEVDYHVGRVLQTLQERGLSDNTIIIYTSDHGDNAGDMGRWGKVNFYEGSVHVPLLAVGPGVPSRRVRALCELIDIGQTACDFQGAQSHRLDQGRSLKPLFTGATDQHRPDVFTEMGSDKMLFDGQWKLMYGDITRDTRRELNGPPMNGPAFGRPVTLPPDKISLFDLQSDPHEANNLADDPAHAAKLNEMKEKLLQRLIANLQAREEGEGSVL